MCEKNKQQFSGFFTAPSAAIVQEKKIRFFLKQLNAKHQ
jgi:hypothetical protein